MSEMERADDVPATLKCDQVDNERSLSRIFQTLRAGKELFDINLATSDGILSAHKVVLSAFSPVLRCLVHEFAQPHALIYMKGVSLEDLTHLLTFLYEGEVTVPRDKLSSLFALAKELKVKDLTTQISSNIIETQASNVRIDNSQVSENLTPNNNVSPNLRLSTALGSSCQTPPSSNPNKAVDVVTSKSNAPIQPFGTTSVKSELSSQSDITSLKTTQSEFLINPSAFSSSQGNQLGASTGVESQVQHAPQATSQILQSILQSDTPAYDERIHRPLKRHCPNPSTSSNVVKPEHCHGNLKPENAPGSPLRLVSTSTLMSNTAPPPGPTPRILENRTLGVWMCSSCTFTSPHLEIMNQHVNNHIYQSSI